jgi:hypothetical protein
MIGCKEAVLLVSYIVISRGFGAGSGDLGERFQRTRTTGICERPIRGHLDTGQE